MLHSATTSVAGESVIPESIVALAWYIGLIAVTITAIGIVTHVRPVVSTRLSGGEKRARAHLRPSERLGVINDGNRHPWNALVERHALSYAQARTAAHRSRRILAVALWFVTPLTIVGPALTWINVVARASTRSTQPPLEMSLVVVGGAYAILISVLVVPAAAVALLNKVQRDRIPLAWRILARGSAALRWLSVSEEEHKELTHGRRGALLLRRILPRRNPVLRRLKMSGAEYRNLAHERARSAPGQGPVISAPMAQHLLDPLEAELIVTMKPNARATAGRELEWGQRHTQLLGFLLREKARLFNVPNALVPLRDVYSWLDLVASECVLEPTGTIDIHDVGDPHTLFNSRTTRNARNILGYNVVAVSGLIVGCAFLAFSLACVGLGALVPVLSTVSVPWIDSMLATVTAGAVLGAGGWAIKALKNRQQP